MRPVLLVHVFLLGLLSLASQAQETPPAKTNEKINKTLPSWQPRQERELPKNPSDQEVESVRCLSISLKARGSKTEDNRDLAAALKEFKKAAVDEDYSALQNYVESHPDSKWNIALLANLGQAYFSMGRFEQAMDAWQQAWILGKDVEDAETKAIVDLSIGELAKMNARIGRMDKIEAILEELKGRSLTGPATEMITGAAEGLWLMKNQPQRAFLCGPMAIQTLYMRQNPNPTKFPSNFENAKSTQRGTSLIQIKQLADAVGMKYQMAWKEPGAALIIPSVANWKVGHWAALTERRDGRVLADDPTFGERMWIKEPIIDQETSGYFLVPAGSLPTGWRAVASDEGAKVWGKGTTSSTDPDPYKPCDAKSSGGCAGCGEGGPSATGYAMAVASGHLAIVSLNIVDVPLFYTPPRGPALELRLTYNQRDANQAAPFYYSNFGSKWTFDWLAFIKDNPNSPNADVKRYVSGGGAEDHKNFNSATLSFEPSLYTQSTLVRTSVSPISYERRFSDGSKEIYDVSDGSVSSTRRVFLRQIIDPQGNTLTFTYDFSYNSSPRIVAVTDALNQVTTISYGLGSDPLKITSVTDPFGRTASFDYTNGYLTKITDMVGITSQFTYYGTSTPYSYSLDFINTLTTPYGTSTFQYADHSTSPSLAARTRWLEMTDPLGAKERIEYNELTTTGIPNSVPSNTVPVNMYNRNSIMYARNTFYWSKKAMMAAPGVYSGAHVYHWVHYNGLTQSGSFLESEKAPLENRVWFNYSGQSYYPWGTGAAIYDSSVTETKSSNQPTIMGRVLDDGTTQTYRRDYNSGGRVTRESDPAWRVKTYKYASNGIDLLEVYQQNPAGTSTDPYGVAADKLMTYGNYNSLHQPQTVIDSAGQTKTYTYNAQGQKLTEKVTRNGVNETTTWNYTNGYLTSVVGPIAGATTSYTYDAIGRVKTVTDSDGYTTTYAYDALNRVTLATYPNGTYTQTLYNRLDPEWERDRLGRWTHKTYDALRRLVTVTDPEGHTVEYDWCHCGALDGIYDGNRNYTGFEQDVQGRVTKKTYADTTATIYTYETTTSRLKSMLDAKSQTTTYGYNVDNTLASTTYTGAQYTTPNVSYDYDTAYSRLSKVRQGTGTPPYPVQYDYTYKPIGTLGANQVNTIDGPLANDTLAYTYDELGRVLSRTINATGETVTFDALGRMATATNPLGAFTYHYVNQTQRLDYVDRPGGQKVDYSYYGNGGDNRLSEIKNLGPSAAPISKFNYEYDSVGNIRKWTQQMDAAGAQYYDLSYNGADELVSAIFRDAATNAAVTPYTYRYDAAGNRTSEQVGSAVRTEGPNSLNQLKTIAAGGALTLEGTVSEPATVTVMGQNVPVDINNRFKTTIAAVVGANSVPITATDGSGNVTSKTAQFTVSAASKTLNYDLDGNRTSDGVKTYEWDAANRLLAVNYAGTGNRSEFAYDGLGRRTQIVEKTNNTVTSTKNFVWIGNSIAEERDASNAITKRFYAEGERTGTVSYLFNKDHLGSIREMMNLAGSVRVRYVYDPYGRRTKTVGYQEADFGYTGHYYHDRSTFHLTLYRAYDADKGRWLSRDPIGERGGINLYAYVSNSPINLIDPAGLQAVDSVSQGALGGYGAEVAAIARDILATGAVAEACRPKKCKPCNPPVGTRAGRVDLVPPSRPHKPFTGSHVHIYEMQQSPPSAGCVCFWKPVDVVEGDKLPDGVQPITPAGGGGVE